MPPNDHNQRRNAALQATADKLQATSDYTDDDDNDDYESQKVFFEVKAKPGMSVYAKFAHKTLSSAYKSSPEIMRRRKHKRRAVSQDKIGSQFRANRAQSQPNLSEFSPYTVKDASTITEPDFGSKPGSSPGELCENFLFSVYV